MEVVRHVVSIGQVAKDACGYTATYARPLPAIAMARCLGGSPRRLAGGDNTLPPLFSLVLPAHRLASTGAIALETAAGATIGSHIRSLDSHV
jgi:hypothetical protein